MNSVAHEEERGHNLTGLINALYIQGHLDLDRLLNCTWKEICQARRIGVKKHALLLSLLERISADPKTIENHKIPPSVTMHIEEEIGELTLKEIIRKNKETQVNLLKVQEAIEKEDRLKKIKDRLREMGMIH
ncbi:hypothetical protein BSK49_19180 [Paenibacillus odorifer]|uniref:RNA polymerase alpha subunit C-terminal domain-containing protein n=1 Tax=Paenibacillus odorifer TaxID=189426 RepID=A0ABX3GTZ1_9BACL|nr:hypothetical protein [Paenibacillus odorifer]OMD34648.1 hypothetical protein BSO21_10810 [Paenibacillus odorifer]OMD85641.1 hypothetical protein BSK49_19180 [Paenibacillus odorifer]